MTVFEALESGSREITIDGVRQRYHVAGTGPVCIIHSGGPGIAWEYLRMPALEAKLTTVYVEPIGTGQSGRLPVHPHGYTLDRYARFLHGIIIAHLDVPKVYLLGHSHGGLVAQRHALIYPGRLAGMILYSSAPSGGPELFAEATRNIEAFVRRHEGRPEAADILKTWASIGGIADDAGFTAVMRQLLPAYFADYWGREREFASLRADIQAFHVISGPAPFDDRNNLASITTPTLVITGQHDFICGLRWARDLFEGIPGSKLHVLDHSGHMGHLEEPAIFAEAVTNFVRLNG
jgi:pimeloyl-ACP methyl ester carboxylesterase